MWNHRPESTPHAAELDDWLAKGYAGTMRYLHRQAKRRKNPKINVPEALSVIVALDNYYWPDSDADARAPRIAKYARGQDYHRVTRRRLDRLGEYLLEHGASVAHSYVDNGPIPERELAQRAGLGWIGKNTMVIRPGAGSFFFIGTIFTDLALPPDTPFETDHCGSCTRCLDACPTAAFVAPRILDATRCISYLTIEQRGPIPDEIAPASRDTPSAATCAMTSAPGITGSRSRRRSRSFVPCTVSMVPVRVTSSGWTRRNLRPASETRLFERPGLAGMRRNVHAAFASVEQHVSAELHHFTRLFEHDRWANAETLRLLQEGVAPPKAVRWMGHIIGAEHLWLARLNQEAPNMSVWPDIDLYGCQARLEELDHLWPEYLAKLEEDDLDDGRAYRNSIGEFWTSTVGDILTHVVDALRVPPRPDRLRRARERRHSGVHRLHSRRASRVHRMTSSPGPLLVTLGVALILVGLLVWAGGLKWFGHLPGDIRIERDSVRVYIPLASMLVVSVVLSLVLYLRRLF